MYKVAKSRVKYETSLSGLFACNMGVRQGDNLSPLLFSIFLNDFEQFLSQKYNGLPMVNTLAKILGDEDVEYFINMYVLLYADDTLILAETAAQLQLALNALHEYCSKWMLHINRDKTKVVIFAKGKVRVFPIFSLGDENIQVTDDYIYLGVTFNYNGNFQKAIKTRVNAARRAMFSLRTQSRRLQLPIDIQCDLFDKMIVPILLYGCEIWGVDKILQVEVFYRKYLKIILGLSDSTPNCVVYGEVGKLPLEYQINKRMVNFWIKISEGKSTKLSRKMYDLIYTLHIRDEYHSPWLLKIKDLICNSGYPSFWHDQLLFQEKFFMVPLVCKQFEDQKLQIWNHEVNTNGKCGNYKIFKLNHVFERYLINLSYGNRIYLCKYRAGCHNLPVSEARINKDRPRVFCELCEKNDIGDEFHYLFTCTMFKEQRKKYLKKYYYSWPSTFKMEQLFNSKDMKILTNLAYFCREIMSYFKKSRTAI